MGRPHHLWHHLGFVQVLRSVAELRAWRQGLSPREQVALVPTMGFLHAGHRSLLTAGRQHVPRVVGQLVLTIFVNPTQFGPNEDLDRYPRDETRDLAVAQACEVDVVFAPKDPSELYAADASTWVTVAGLDSQLCGVHRPGHFRGVCTVVCKLWQLVRPDVAVFGEKDYQQLAIIRRMHRDLFLSGSVIAMPIVREPDGLAMSSRNANLSAAQRRDATAIGRWLSAVRERFEAGERKSAALMEGVDQAVAPGVVEYAEIVDIDNLQPVATIARPALCATAVVFGGVRLIDNVVLRP